MCFDGAKDMCLSHGSFCHACRGVIQAWGQILNNLAVHGENREVFLCLWHHNGMLLPESEAVNLNLVETHMRSGRPLSADISCASTGTMGLLEKEKHYI